jgi:hypothetical protein
MHTDYSGVPQIRIKSPERFGKNIFELWEEGAKSIETTAPGRIITAPVRLAEKATGATGKVIEATGKTAEAAPGIAKSIPLILIILAGGIAAYFVFAGKKGTALIPGTHSTPELM